MSRLTTYFNLTSTQPQITKCVKANLQSIYKFNLIRNEMNVNKLVLDLKSSSKFTQSSLHSPKPHESNNAGKYYCFSIAIACLSYFNRMISTGNNADDYIGGVIQNGQLSWIARGAQIEIHSMQTGTKVSSYTFDNHLPRSGCDAP